MENKRKALGTGLEQLFNNQTIDIDKMEKEIVAHTDAKDIIDVNLSELRNNPYQPRKHFDEEKLHELSESIKEYGVFEPIIIKKSIKGYEIVAGERRVRASMLAGKTTIPAIIKDFTENEMMEIALIENIQRENLNAIEEAFAYSNLIQKLNLTQEQLSKKLGKSRSYVTNMIGLLRLPVSVQDDVVSGAISMGHARVLSKIEERDKIIEYAKKIKSDNITVRKLEDMVSNSDVKKARTGNYQKTRKYNDIELVMREKIGTMVKISDKKIEIPFDSEKDLERILEILNININKE